MLYPCKLTCRGVDLMKSNKLIVLHLLHPNVRKQPCVKKRFAVVRQLKFAIDFIVKNLSIQTVLHELVTRDQILLK